MVDKLTKITGWLPFLLIAFLNALVDIGHKIIIQNTIFKTYDVSDQMFYMGIVNLLLLIPFLWLFTISGFISDRFKKPSVMKISALVAVGLTLLITFCYYQGYFWAAFGLTFALATQSAIYSPSKYGYIKEILGSKNLSTGNGAVQAVTIVAILSGAAIFSFFYESMYGSSTNPSEAISNIKMLGWLLVACSSIEAFLAFRLPDTIDGNKNIKLNKIDFIKLKYLKTNFKVIYNNKIIWLSIIGLSVFWGISQVLMAVFPAYIKDTMNETNVMVIQGILALSGIGIIIGAGIVSKISKNYIETGTVPIGAIGVLASLSFMPFVDSLYSFGFLFFTLGLSGAVFIIPLNSLIQFHAKENELGTVLAGNNFIQTVFMVLFLSITIAASALAVNPLYVFYGLIVVAIIGSIYTLIKLPQSFVRLIIAFGFKKNYKLKVMGFKNIPEQGGVLLLSNHISFIDWAIIQMSSPRQVNFVMERSYYSKWYLKWFFDIFGVIPISKGNSKSSLVTITEALNDGKVVCLFPEGAISHNGQLSQFKKGFEAAAKDANDNVVIIPMYLRGLWGTKHSRSSNKLKHNSQSSNKNDVIVSYGKPMDIKSTNAQVKQKVFELSFSSWEEYTNTLDPIHTTWLRKAKESKGMSIADYAMKTELSHTKLITAVLLFGKKIKSLSKNEQNIGILLPSSSAAAITNLSTLMLGKTVVNINYTTAIDSINSSLDVAEVKSIYTSKKFVDKLKGRGFNANEIFKGKNVYYLEELRQQFSKKESLLALLKAKFLPTSILETLYCKKVDMDSPAAILFSSGSEGTPKGIVLSHRNIMANVKQITDVLNTQDSDVILNSLPTFHAFGLTVTTMLPLIEGVPFVCHPDPTDSVNIGKAVAKYNVTVLCATSTFFRMYAKNKKVKPLMFDSLRIVIGGAEKIAPDVRTAFESKFHKQIFEGYGATETTPVASVNLPDHLNKKFWSEQKGFKNGTVGLPVPGTAFKIVDPNTMEELPIEEDGLILIGGTQIMLGYLNDKEKTDEVITVIDGKRWYKSGDKGHVDTDGFLTIVDRYSRFAKIGGEMISLSAVEEEVKKYINTDDISIIAVNLPDEKKGEKIILLVAGDINLDELKQTLNASEMLPIMTPSILLAVEEITKLGSGKSDFKGAAKVAAELL
jgi:acyl-[acyl-carrier-protein]-phospholipid O-acyltransferase/long-chain-fatty-acid--[acyl-carrier-protein] ligase